MENMRKIQEATIGITYSQLSLLHIRQVGIVMLLYTYQTDRKCV